MHKPDQLIPKLYQNLEAGDRTLAANLGTKTMLKKLTLAIAAASAVSATSFAVAETVQSPVGDFDISMNVGLTTDYIFRGVSQTQGKGAIQGGLDVAHDSGLYIGTWASNVDFIAADGNDANVEFDYYLGFGNDITENVSYDLGWIKYDYPGASAANFSEFYGSVTAYGFKVGAAYSEDFPMFGGNGIADDNSTLYTYVGYEYTLPYEIGLALQYGNYDFKDDIFLDSAGVASEDSYNDWSLGLTKTLAGLDFGLTYTDTSLSDSECKGFAAGGKSDYCDANFVLSVSKTL